MRRPAAAFVVANTLLLWLATAVAAAALWPVYQSGQFVLLVAVATAVGSGIAIVGAMFRWQSAIVLLVIVVAYFALGVPLAVPAKAMFGVLPTVPGLADLASAVALSWKQLLTITLPVGSYQALLVPALILVLVTTTAGLSIALRSRRGELAVIAPVVLFVIGALFGPPTASWPIALGLGLLAAVLLWLIWWRRHRRREAIRLLAAQAAEVEGRPLETVADRGFLGARALLSALLIMAIAGAAAAAATLWLPPTGQRQVLRSAIEQPFDPRAYPSPLSGFRHYEQEQQADRTQLTVSGLPKGGRIRIATLDTYDGIVYSVGSDQVTSESGSFTRVPYTFDQSKVRGTPVTLHVTVDGYSGVWLPTVGRFESVDFGGADATTLRDDFSYNDTSGTAADVHGLRSGDSYTLTAVLPRQPAASALASLRPGSAQVPAIGVLPDELSTTLSGWVAGVKSPGAQLAAMIAAMKKNGYVSHGVSKDDPPSRSGHAADRITQLLTDQRMIGDQEQYAVTAALMAQQLGFPARVVFGFAPQDARPGAVTQVRGDDVSAWIEVDTAEYGWVTVDPTPPVRPIPKEQPQLPTQIARPQSPVQPPPVLPDTQSNPAPPDSSQDQPSAPNPWLGVLVVVLTALGWTLLGVGVLMAPFIVIVAAKLRRRRLRRRASSAIQRISGGWQEFQDAVVDHGFEPPPSPTRTEVAAVVGGMQPLVLAAVADRAVFSPGDADEESVEQVWRSVDELRATLDDGLTRRQRLRAAVSLRSLGGYSVRSLFKR